MTNLNKLHQTERRMKTKDPQTAANKGTLKETDGPAARLLCTRSAKLVQSEMRSSGVGCKAATISVQHLHNTCQR